MRNYIIPAFLCLTLLFITGCGQTHVSGKIVFDDGSPLTRGNILFENDQFTYSSKIQNDGSFDMGMLKDGEGIPEGQYRIAVVSLAPGEETKVNPKLMTDIKYASSKTSGITYDIQKKTTDIEIVVEKAK